MSEAQRVNGQALTSGTPIRAVRGASVWSGTDLADRDDWVRHLSANEVDTLLEAVDAARRLGVSPEELRRDDFDMTAIDPLLYEVANELENGRGFVLLRGLPVGGLSEADCRLLFWALGMQLGVPICQSGRGELLAEVKDVGGKMGEATSRAFRSSGPLRFHTDQVDLLGLMCIRTPVSGGLSQVVSSAAVHNAFLERRPDYLKLLYEPFCFSRQGQEIGSERPWYARPVFGWKDGCFTSYFSRTYIESAQRLEGPPRLTDEQEAALRYASGLAAELTLNIAHEKGDIQFFNSHVTWHARTDYLDHAEPERKRTLLRLWLATPFSRPLPEYVEEFYGSSQPGALRGGVPPADGGRRYAYANWEEAGWPAEVRQRLVGAVRAGAPMTV